MTTIKPGKIVPISDLWIDDNLRGRSGAYNPLGNGLGFTVYIVDVRSAYGRKDVLVRPAMGVGQAWVSLNKVKVNESCQ